MNFKETVIAYAIVWILCIYGWFANLYKLTQCDFDTPLKAEVIRGIGIIIPPAGVIMGFIDIKDAKS
jgi:hypothetical protein